MHPLDLHIILLQNLVLTKKNCSNELSPLNLSFAFFSRPSSYKTLVLFYFSLYLFFLLPFFQTSVIFICTVFLQVLPLPKDVVTHLDYSSKLRLALCYFRLKSVTGAATSKEEAEPKPEGPSQSSDVVVRTRPQLFNLGMLQDMMMEVGV